MAASPDPSTAPLEYWHRRVLAVEAYLELVLKEVAALRLNGGAETLAKRLILMAVDEQHQGDVDCHDIARAAAEMGVVVDVAEVVRGAHAD